MLNFWAGDLQHNYNIAVCVSRALAGSLQGAHNTIAL